MPTPVFFPDSLDPNIPGDGHPLQAGDVVQHTGAPGVEAVVVAVETMQSNHYRQRVQVTREQDNMQGFRRSAMGMWEDTNWQLLRRPGVTTPQPVPPLPASLDPNVFGDGRPLRRGDIVRYVGDAHITDGTVDAQVAGEGTAAGTLVMRKYGDRSTHFHNTQWPQRHFILVKRPGPAEMYLMPPAHLRDGLRGEWPDLDFAKGVAEWLLLVRDGRVTHESLFGVQPGVPNTMPMAFRDALSAVKQFCSARGVGAQTDYTVHDNFEPLCGTDTSERMAEGIMRNLVNIFNAYDTSIRRCAPCSALGLRREDGSTECAHYVCDLCSRTRTGGRCKICEALHIDSGAYTEGVRVCLACCTHTSCTEVGCEETMLKRHQCPTCKRGPKFCKCPGCEVQGCHDREVKTCCGGCIGHCSCRTMCMRHTGMQRLHKWVAPEGEQGMTRLLGTEIETYGSANLTYSPLLRKAVKLWKASVITDGSIGGRGVELVTQPAGGSQWRQMIADLGAGFKESQSITRDTCGLHMHVDCTDVDGMALKRIIRLYAHIEFCLYDAITYKRQAGNYSKPNGAKLLTWLDNDAAKFDEKMAVEEQKKRLSYIQYNLLKGQKIPKLGEKYRDSWGNEVVATKTSIQALTSRWDEIVMEHTRSKGDANRYSGLNMHSYWLRGTLEFRHHHGTNDPEKITNWGFVCGSIVDYCVKHTDADMDMLVALEPRLAMAMVLEGQPEVITWLESRWEKFTTGHRQRHFTQPEPDPVTGEV